MLSWGLAQVKVDCRAFVREPAALRLNGSDLADRRHPPEGVCQRPQLGVQNPAAETSGLPLRDKHVFGMHVMATRH